MKTIKHIILAATALLALIVTAPAFAQKVFVFDPQAHSWSAFDNGELVGTGRASGGSSYCRDLGRSCHTPVGVFHVLSKGSASCKSSKFPIPGGGAPMPYCMFFSGNYAIHGSNEVPPGRNASHGCIRVVPSAALWLTRNFIDIGTKVVVKPY
ncbi:MAG TPA: L,D-transpeptidase [Gammaproteobacteria bacterium]|nr:L,D-transpeptidase [Gammaproteobacteria bacterium]